jgi:hypothetical protein
MGIQPSEFWRMSLWAYRVTATYWAARRETEGPGLSEAEIDELWTWMADKPETVKSLVQ